ncbi:histone H3.v1-like [Camellia sinensis]|uniref:histone H3.v1-like n=1 Tax=Camellia sinensis TaxID=4442 RepID=UPI001036BB0B|nr:histone H3.v1-like [Camellia sinensis]
MEKRKLLPDPKEEAPEVQSAEEEEEEDQEQETPLQRRKRVIVTSSDFVEDPTHETTARVVEEELTSEGSESQIEEREIEKEQAIPIQRKKRRKMTVSPSNLVEDLIREAAAKAVEQEHSKAIIVFQRAEKRRSLSNLTFPSSPKETPITTPSMMVADSSIEGTSSSPSHALSPLPSSSPFSLDLLVTRTMETAEDAPPISPIPMQSFVPSTKALSAPFMSTDEVDIFDARLASLFDMPSTSPMASDETEPLVLADSLLEIFESSSSSSKPSSTLMVAAGGVGNPFEPVRRKDLRKVLEKVLCLFHL